MDSVITLRKFCQGVVCLQGNDSVLEFQVYQRKHFKGIRKKKILFAVEFLELQLEVLLKYKR